MTIIIAIGLLFAGTAFFVVGHRQKQRQDFTNVPLVSPRTKHVLGFLLVFAALLVFFSAFVDFAHMPSRPQFRR
jgi:hypothetical protein